LLRGFKSVGYHWYIRRDGTLEKGRPEHVFGAHCKAGGMNRVSIGVCFEGHGDHEPLTHEQSSTWLHNLYPAIYERWPIGADNVHGHNEFEPGKTCPGRLINMDDIRGDIIRTHQWSPGIDRATITPKRIEGVK
jgi:N-acetylmuramoyl-L-alanine amidase